MAYALNPHSPFYDPTALRVASRHFQFLPAPPGIEVFPWARGRRFLFRTIELAGHPYADYRSLAPSQSILDDLLSFHAEACRGRIIELGCIAEGDASHEGIASWARRNRMFLTSLELARAPYLDIDGSWESYRAGKRAKSWKNISRAQRLLEEKGGALSFRIVDTAEGIAGVFDSCMSLYSANWNRLNSSSIFLSGQGRAFLKDLFLSLAQEGKAEVALLEQGAVLLAFAMTLKRDGTYYFYVFSANKSYEFEKYSVGKIIVRDILESVFRRKFARFDFMAGEEPYKYEWTKLSRKRTSYFAVRDTFSSRMALSIFIALTRLAALLKRQRWLRRILAAGAARAAI